ncbi:MAG: hypothetical protein AAF492_25475, partial [Verrucomicrobiota bacterium]
METWMDRSGNENHATRDASAGETAIERITNAINGRATVEFAANGNEDYLELAVPVVLDTSSGGAGGSAFVVARTTDSIGNDTLMSTTSNQQFFRQTGAQVRFYNGQAPDPQINGDNLTNNRIRYADFNYDRSGRIRYFVDGTELTANNEDNLDEGGFSLTSVGGEPDAGCCAEWEGDIAEILIWERVLSDTEQQQVGLYLAEKYGIVSTYQTAAELSVSSIEPDFVAETSAGVGGQLNAIGAVADVRLHVGLSDGGTNASAWDESIVLGSYTSIVAVLSHTLTGLTDGVTYYYALQATNCAFDTWSTSRSFTTVLEPAVDHNIGAVTGSDEATLYAELLAGHVANLIIFRGGSDGGTNVNAWDEFVEFGEVTNGVYSTVATGLVACTPNYYRAYASNDLGAAWAPSTTLFQVFDRTPTIETDPSPDLSDVC